MARHRASTPTGKEQLIEPPGRQIGVVLDSMAPWEAWSAALCTLAWPDRIDLDRPMGEAQACLVNSMVRARAELQPDWSWQPLRIKPAYLLLAPGNVSRSVRATQQRLLTALTTARIVRPFFQQDVLGITPPLPPSIPRVSLNTVTEYVLQETSGADPHNFEGRQFRRMLPVLHIAMALEQVLASRTAVKGGQPPSLQELAWDVQATQELVLGAVILRPLVQRIHQFRVKAADQIDLVLATSGREAGELA